jgi:hypothetical protein
MVSVDNWLRFISAGKINTTIQKLECSIKKMGGTMYELDVSKLADGAYYLSTFSNEGESKRMFNVLRIN